MLAGRELEYSAVVFTVGAAVISVLRWLIDLRNRLSVEGLGSIQQEVSLVLQRGKHNVAEQAADAIRDAVASVLDGGKSPFTVFVQEAQQAVRLSAPASEVAAWFRTREFHDTVSPVADTAVNNGKRASADALCSEDAALESRCAEAFAAVRSFEETHKIDAAGSHPSAVNTFRTHVVSYALGYGSSFGFKDETVADAMLLFDRVAASGVDFDLDQVQLIVCACVLMMGRLCEPPDRVHSVVSGLPALAGFDSQVVATMEGQIRSALGDDVAAISTLRIAHLYLERLGCLSTPGWYADQLTAEIHALVVQVSCAPVFMKFNPSVVAAALLYCVRKQRGGVPAWPAALAAMTGYSVESTPGFVLCVQLVDGLIASQASANGNNGANNSASNGSGNGTGTAGNLPSAPTFDPAVAQATSQAMATAHNRRVTMG